jgi:hypothetical protein
VLANVKTVVARVLAIWLGVFMSRARGIAGQLLESEPIGALAEDGPKDWAERDWL